MENKKDGFRVGNYFCTFPDGNFIEETKDDGVYVTLEIYRVQKDNSMVSIKPGEITPEIEEQINEELNKMLLAAAEQAEKEGKNV